MSDSIVFSADSHVIEPGDLWTKRIDARFRDRAPHIVHEAEGMTGDLFACEGLRPFPVAGLAVAGEEPSDFGEKMRGGYDGIRPSAWDPVERLEDQDADGVAGEVLYTSLGMGLYGLKDGELRAACFRAYNDWLAEYVSHDRSRLAGVALIPMDTDAMAIAELERAARLGLKGGMIWGAPPASRPYDRPDWDPIWAVAQACEMPLSLHILTGADGHGVEGASIMRAYPSLPHRMERAISDLIFGGALARFPKLRFVSAENDIGWIAHFLQRLDHSWTKYRFMEADPIPEPPSTYFRRQVYATFQDDRVGVLTREFVGTENLMWASDFPHSDSTWPHSREVIERDFEGIPVADRHKITAGNCAALYELG